MSFDPYETTRRDPFGAADFDPLESTRRDPLQDTVPDLFAREPRLSRGQRRALEACALLVLVPGLLGVWWVDDEHQAAGWKRPDHVTVVPRGGTGTLGHVRLRLLGRDTTAPAKSLTHPGAAKLTLIVELRPLDAQGAKDAPYTAFDVRDREGHVWSAYGPVQTGHDPAVGVPVQLRVTSDLPGRELSSVVLEARQGSLTLRKAGVPSQVLRFAH